MIIPETNAIYESQFGLYYWRNFAVSFRILPWACRIGSSQVYIGFVYFGVGLVVLLLMLIVATYQFSLGKTMPIFIWAAVALRHITVVVITLLYLPMLELLLSSVACDSSFKNIHFPSESCWQSAYIWHSVIGIIFAFFLSITTGLMSFLFYDPSYSNSNAIGMVSPYYSIYKFFYCTFLIIFLTTFQRVDLELTFAVICTLGSLGQLYFLITQRPYRSQYILKLEYVLSIFLVWHNFSLVLSFSLKSWGFNCFVVLLIFGLFMSFIEGCSYRMDPNISFVSQSLSENEKEIENFLVSVRYFLQLISQKNNNESFQSIISGIVRFHTIKCDRTDCPLSKYSKEVEKITKLNSELHILHNKKSYEKIHKYLILYIIRQFERRLNLRAHKKDDFPLRIEYIRLLMEIMQAHNLAVSELILIQDSKASFLSQFQLYLLRQKIEKELKLPDNQANQDLGESPGEDYSTAAAFQNAMAHFSKRIEWIATLSLRFWSTLGEEEPNFHQVSELGEKIVEGFSEIEGNFKNLEKIYKNNLQCIKLYMDFVRNVKNDTELHKYLKESMHKIQKALTQADSLKIDKVKGVGTNCEDGVILASGNANSLGRIISVNLGLCRILGYMRSQLIGQPIEVLMPGPCRKLHLQTLTESSKLGGRAANRFVLALASNRYLVPMHKRIKPVYSLRDGLNFCCSLTIDRKAASSTTGFLFLDTTKKVVATTSSCIRLLQISNSTIFSQQIDFTKMCPAAFDPLTKAYYNRQFPNEQAEVFFPLPKNVTSFQKNSDYFRLFPSECKEISLAEESVSLWLSWNEFNITGQGLGGYIVHIVQPVAANSYDSRLQIRSLSPSYFSYEPLQNKFVLIQNTCSSKSIVYRRSSDLSTLIPPTSDQLKEFQSRKILHEEEWIMLNNSSPEELRLCLSGKTFSDSVKEEESTLQQLQRLKKTLLEKQRYGDGVTLYRLEEEGEILVAATSGLVDAAIDSQSESNPTLGQSPEASEKTELLQDSKESFVKSTIGTRKKLCKILFNTETPKPVKILEWIFNILLFCFCTLATTEYWHTITNATNSLELLVLMKNEHELAEALVEFSMSTLYVISANKKGIPKISNLYRASSLSEFNTYEAKRMERDLQQYVRKNEIIRLAKAKLNPENENNRDTEYVSMIIHIPSENIFKEENVTMERCITHMGSLMFTLLNFDFTQLVVKTQEVGWIQRNLYGNFGDTLPLRLFYLMKDITYIEGKLQEVLIGLTIGCAVLVLVWVCSIAPVFSSVRKIRGEILSFFLRVPMSEISILATKCEIFIQKLKNDFEEDSENSEDEEERIWSSGNYREKEHREFLQNASNKRSLFEKCIIIAVVMFAYLGANYYVSWKLSATCVAHSQEMYRTCTSTIKYELMSLMLIKFYGEGKIPLKGYTLSQMIDYAKDHLDQIYQNIGDNLVTHKANEGNFAAKYKEIYNLIYKGNLCNIISEDLTAVDASIDCSSLSGGLVPQGLQQVMIDYAETSRQLFNTFASSACNDKSERNTVLNSQSFQAMENYAMIVIPAAF